MHTLKQLLLASVVTLGVVAQQPAPKPPVLSDAQKAAYWKANAEYQDAATKAQQAAQDREYKQGPLRDAVEALRKACGADYTLGVDANHYPVCVAKPAEVKK
jgi:hypothetical protein